jgi:hypothetical protein
MPDLAPPVDAPPDRPSPPDVAPPATLNMGLVSRWKLDEANGGSTDDSAGNNNGQLSGATRAGPGYPTAQYPNPGSLRFDGNDDFVALGTANLPANNQPQSVAFWFNFAAMPADSRICVSLTDGQGGGSRLKLGFNEGRVAAWKRGGDILVSSPAVGAGWHHYAYTFNGTNHVLYVDGVETNRSNTAPDTGGVGNARLGAGFDNAENYAGQLDEVRVYNRALRADEVAQLHQGLQ